MQLRYPTASPTTIITIRDPQLGNGERVDTHAVIRRTRSGELKSVDNWHNNKVHSFSFSVLTRTERNDLESFLITTAGQEITLFFNSQLWHGFIISPQTDIITEKDDCSYEAAFEFRGRRIS